MPTLIPLRPQLRMHASVGGPNCPTTTETLGTRELFIGLISFLSLSAGSIHHSAKKEKAPRLFHLLVQAHGLKWRGAVFTVPIDTWGYLIDGGLALKSMNSKIGL